MVYSELEIMRDYFLTTTLTLSLFSCQKHIISGKALPVPCFCSKTTIYLWECSSLENRIINFLPRKYDVQSLQKTLEIIRFFVCCLWYPDKRIFILFSIFLFYVVNKSSQIFHKDLCTSFFSLRKL